MVITENCMIIPRINVDDLHTDRYYTTKKRKSTDAKKIAQQAMIACSPETQHAQKVNYVLSRAGNSKVNIVAQFLNHLIFHFLQFL